MKASVASLLKLMGMVLLVATLLGMSASMLRFNPLGYGTLEGPRTSLTLAYWMALALLVLPQFRPHRPALILLVPVLTQVNNVVMGWDLPTGAFAPIRLLPYLLLCGVMIADMKSDLSKAIAANKWLWVAFGLLGLLGAAGGWANEAQLWLPTLLFYSLFFPLWATYLNWSLRRGDRDQLTGAAFVAGMLGIFSTLVIIGVGSQLDLGGKAGIAGTRNVSDINVVLPYLVLLWPFVVIGLRQVGGLVGGAAMCGLLGVAFLGLSRLGMVLLPLLLLVTLAWWVRKDWKPAVLSVGVVTLLITFAYLGSAELRLAGDLLLRRFNVAGGQDFASLTAQFAPGGGESLQRDVLRTEALRMATSEPLWGVGAGNFTELSRAGFGDAHSLSLTVLAEFGLIGLASLYLVLGAIAWCLIHAWQSTRSSFVGLMGTAFCLWLIMAHTAGSNLATMSVASFGVNAATGAYLLLYLFARDWTSTELEST